MNTFEKEVVWSTMEYDDESGNVIEVEKKKKLSFKELDKFDKSQAKFHFFIASIPNNLIEVKDDFVIDSGFIYDLTVKFIDEMAIINDTTDFKDQDQDHLIR